MRPVLVAMAVGLSALGGLGGCANQVKTVSATSHTVILQYPPARRQAADDRAAALCADYGRRAQVRSLHDQYVRLEQSAIYDCIGRS